MIPSAIDCVVHRAITNTLEEVYEPVFIPVSFGFRYYRNQIRESSGVHHLITICAFPLRIKRLEFSFLVIRVIQVGGPKVNHAEFIRSRCE
jgi:hypothetical protein